MKINFYKFDTALKKGYSLDHIFLLQLVKEEIEVSKLIEDNSRIEGLYATLIRKNLIFNNKVTLEGDALLNFINSTTDVVYTKVKVLPDIFDTWWDAYPRTDTFTINGKTFSGCRNLRPAKAACLEKFNKIILEGEHTGVQMVEALVYDVTQKKKESIKQGANKLTFMQNSLTYLNQRSFESFIELIKEGVSTETFVSKGSFDI